MKQHGSGAIVFFLIFFFLTNIIHAQSAPGIEWQKCLGGTDWDQWNCIIQTTDGGYIIAGRTSSDDGDVVGKHAYFDGWIIKLDSYGDILWQKCLGGSGSEGIYSIIQTSDGGYAVAASTYSNDGDVSGLHGSNEDFWVVKLDFLGNMKWQRCLGGTGEDWAYSIIEVSDEGGGFVVAGYTASTDGDVSGKHGGGKSDTADAWVVKLSSSGTIVWQKCLGGSSGDAAYSVIETSDRGFIIAGTTSSNDGDVSGNHGSVDGWLVKLNNSGIIQWQKCLGGSREDGIYSIIQTSDGGYAVAGGSRSNDGDVSGNRDTANGDAWIIKLNSSGDMLWQKSFGGSKYDEASAIVQTSDGGYVFTGATNSNDGDVSGFHGVQNSDSWVVRLNSHGNLIWQKCLGGTLFDHSNSIIETNDKGYIIAGYTNSADGDVSGLHAGLKFSPYDAWVIKLNADAGVENSSTGPTNFSWVYPNPSLDQVHLQLYHSLSVKQVQFYNLLGMQYYPDYRIENTIVDVDAHTLPAASYVMRISYLNSDIEEVRKFLHYQ